MFTRKNIALALVIYLLFFLFFIILLGENGILMRAELRKNAIELESANEKKAADILLLREEKANRDSMPKDGELLYSFDNQDYSDTANENVVVHSEFEAMSSYKAAMFSLLPSVLYLLIVFAADKRRRK